MPNIQIKSVGINRFPDDIHVDSRAGVIKVAAKLIKSKNPISSITDCLLIRALTHLPPSHHSPEHSEHLLSVSISFASRFDRADERRRTLHILERVSSAEGVEWIYIYIYR